MDSPLLDGVASSVDELAVDDGPLVIVVIRSTEETACEFYCNGGHDRGVVTGIAEVGVTENPACHRSLVFRTSCDAVCGCSHAVYVAQLRRYVDFLQASSLSRNTLL